MSKSDNLRKAKSNKNDEYYTRIEDIEKEILLHEDYVRQFEGKTVYCNCDNPEWSNFYKFFKIYFHQLKLKKLITTHFNSDGSSYKIEWSGEMLNDDMLNLIKTPLKGNGDFNSDECIEILKESDIIVTNPPFSIARELFIPLLQKYNKKFIIIGDLNWVAYKYVFPLFKDNKIHFGYTNVKEFCTPEGTMTKFGNKTWFTNFDIEKTHKPLILTKTYYGNEEDYPKYDNYDAIECSKVKDIPKDYFPCWYKCPHSSSCIYGQTEGKEDNALCEQACNGEIGVPITYMANHCNEQFAILGSDNDFANNMKDIAEEGTYKNGGPAFYISKKKRSVLSLTKDYTTDLSFADCHKCNGLIGVPITFLENLCDEQFRIMGQTSGRYEDEVIAQPTKKYEKPIQHSYKKDIGKWIDCNGSKANTGATFIQKHTGIETYYTANNVNGELKINYTRILIQRKPVKE